MDPLQPNPSRGRSSNVQQRTVRMFDPRDNNETPNMHSQNKATAINLMEDIAQDIVSRDNILSKTTTTKRDLNQIQRKAVLPPKTVDTAPSAPANVPVQRRTQPVPQALSWVPTSEEEPSEDYSVPVVQEDEPGSALSFLQRPYVLVSLATVLVVLAVLVIALCTRK